MLAVLFLALLFNPCLCIMIKQVDPLKVDYCKQPCATRSGKLENSACDCRRNPDYVEELHDLMEFRESMVYWHNYFRNITASGELVYPEDGRKFPAAANMRAMSYNLEMEYIARCYSVKIYDYHDPCRKTRDLYHSGQNLKFDSDPYIEFSDAPAVWWGEYQYYPPDKIGNFSAGGHYLEKIAHFTQFVWATEFQLGCARGFCATKNKSDFRWAVFCNYGGDGKNFANHPGKPLYTEGPPCLQCPAGLTCNKEYTNLCGEIDPIPKDLPPRIWAIGETPYNYSYDIKIVNVTNNSTNKSEMVYVNPNVDPHDPNVNPNIPNVNPNVTNHGNVPLVFNGVPNIFATLLLFSIFF